MSKTVYIWRTYCDCKYLMDAHVTAFASLCSLYLDIAISHQQVCVNVGKQSRSLTGMRFDHFGIVHFPHQLWHLNFSEIVKFDISFIDIKWVLHNMTSLAT